VIVINTLTVITLIVNVTAHDSIGTHCETLTVIVTSIVTLTITLTVIVTVIFTSHLIAALILMMVVQITLIQ
jgi:hypothetical protein